MKIVLLFLVLISVWYGAQSEEEDGKHFKLTNNVRKLRSSRQVQVLLNKTNGAFQLGDIPREFPNIQEIDFLQQLLPGRIPKSFGELDQLTYLDLSYNGFEGTLPSEIGRLTNLKYLYLSHNRLEGEIPDEIGNLKNLLHLDISNNNFQGKFPKTLHKLVSLTRLSMDNNDFQGPIDPFIGNLTNLTNLLLHENRFTNLPGSIGKLKKLEILNFGKNNITNCPYELGLVEKLKYLDMSHNKMSPQSTVLQIFDLKALQFLDTSHCEFNEKIPASMTEMPVLTSLRALHGFNGNQKQQLPANIGDLKELRELLLAGSGITGGIPESISNLTNLLRLDLSSNEITSLPRANFSEDLYRLNFSNNQLDGEFPFNLGQKRNLEYLDMSFNKLRGKFPPPRLNENDTITMFETLVSLDLSSNEFTQVTSDFELIRGIEHLKMNDNKLSWIHESLVGHSRIYTIELRNNLLDQLNVPKVNKDISSDVEILDISKNRFSGKMPDDIYLLTDLEHLDVSHNRFTRHLDDGIRLQLLTSLTHISLAYNDMNGDFPVELKHLNDLETIYLDGNRYNGSIPTSWFELEQLKAISVVNTSYQGDLPSTWDTYGKLTEFYNDEKRHALLVGESIGNQLLFTASELAPTDGPQNLKFRDVGEQSITFEWNEPSKPNGKLGHYQVELVNTDSKSIVRNEIIQFKVFTANDLSMGANYSFRVRGGTSGGFGPYSKTISVKTLDKCPNGFERLKCTSKECPKDYIVSETDNLCVQFCTDEFSEKAICEGGKLEDLTIRKGYWRASPFTVDIRRCPNQKKCNPTSINEKDRILKETTTAKAKNDTDRYCSPHHTGVYCSECLEGYAMQDGNCKPCVDGQKDQDRLKIIAWSMFFVVVLVLFCARLVYVTRKNKNNGKRKKSLRRKFYRAKDIFSRELGVKMRIVIGFYQVFLQYVKIQSLSDAKSIALGLHLVNLDFFSFFTGFVEVGCWAEVSYFDYLKVYTLAPLIVLSVTWFFVYALIKNCRPDGFKRSFMEWILLLFFLTFLIYPGISSALFRVFLIETFQVVDETIIGTKKISQTDFVLKTLKADYRIEIGSDVESALKIYSICMIFVYPIGILLLFLWGVYRYQTETALPEEQQNQAIVKSVQKLCQPYKPQFRWFESFELFRKLMMTSLFLLIHQAIPDKSNIIFLILNLVFFYIVKQIKPYERKSDHLVAELSFVGLFVLSLLPLLRDKNQNLEVVISVLAIMPLLVLLFDVSRYAYFAYVLKRFPNQSSNESEDKGGDSFSFDEQNQGKSTTKEESQSIREEKVAETLLDDENFIIQTEQEEIMKQKKELTFI